MHRQYHIYVIIMHTKAMNNIRGSTVSKPLLLYVSICVSNKYQRILGSWHGAAVV